MGREALRFPAATQERIDLGAKVERRVRNADHWQIWLQSVGMNRYKELMADGHDRQFQSNATGDVIGMSTCRIDDHVTLNRATIRFQARNATILHKNLAQGCIGLKSH